VSLGPAADRQGPPLRHTAPVSLPPPAAARVEELVGGRIVGAEKQERWRPAWFLEVERPGGERVGVYFRGDRGVEQHGVYPLEHEYEVLRVLEAHGIPVPHVYGFCDEPRGIVMERAPGRANLATATDEAERRSVLDHYVDILAEMHRIPLSAFAQLGLPVPATPEALGLGDLPRWEKSFRARSRQPEPLIEFVLRWLHENAPRHRTRAAFLAGDSGQFLFDAGRVTRVIDLELAYLGDPLADLAGMMSRDLSEPLGDLSRAFRRYGERVGEPVDLPTLLYHAARFAIVTPLATAPLTQAPPPGLNYVQYLGWGLVYGRGALAAIAQREGIALEPPALPEPEPTRFSPAFAHAVALLRGPAEKSYEADVSLRVAQHLAEVDRRGAQLEAQDLEEASALLGRRVRSFREADAALEAFVREAPPARTPEILALLHRRTLRQEALLRPALRELDGVSIQTIRP
jgi:aminoglycoside phosphotransferase (APT) family kinase protein